MINKIQFARDNLNHLQSIINLSDLKAGFLLTVNTILIGSLFAVFSNIEMLELTGFFSFSSLFLACGTVFLFLFIRALFSLVSAIRARMRKIENGNVTGFTYFGHILEMGTSGKYFDVLRAATDDDLLHDLSDNIYHLSIIAHEKCSRINSATETVKYLIFFWLISITILIIR